MRIAFIGGTGPEGKGLAYRFALARHEIIVGSRSAERAETAAREVGDRVTGATVAGRENADAAREAELIVLTVPYAGQADTLPPLREAAAGKTVVSTVVPLSFEGGRAAMIAVPEGSAAEQAQALLPGARIAGAFHNLSAGTLWDGAALDQDVVVCADDDDTKRDVMSLAEQVEGARAVDGGPLANAHFVEGITALLLNINRRYKAHTGIRIVGL